MRYCTYAETLFSFLERPAETQNKPLLNACYSQCDGALYYPHGRDRDGAYASLQETAIKWLSLCSNDACTRACKLVNAGANKHAKEGLTYINS